MPGMHFLASSLSARNRTERSSSIKILSELDMERKLLSVRTAAVAMLFAVAGASVLSEFQVRGFEALSARTKPRSSSCWSENSKLRRVYIAQVKGQKKKRSQKLIYVILLPNYVYEASPRFANISKFRKKNDGSGHFQGFRTEVHRFPRKDSEHVFELRKNK